MKQKFQNALLKYTVEPVLYDTQKFVLKSVVQGSVSYNTGLICSIYYVLCHTRGVLSLITPILIDQTQQNDCDYLTIVL